MKERLQKIISARGVASRRTAEEMLRQGRITVNGEVVALGASADPETDEIMVDGRLLPSAPAAAYIMLHKPRGFVTTLSDEQGRRCVADLVADAGVRLFPVGRLDRNSEGLLLMTNDGEFSNFLTHPKRHVSKVYRVTVRGKATDDQIDKMAVGMKLEEFETLPCDISYIEKHEDRTVLRFVLYEGKNREIRKLCEAVGLTVIRLKRTEIAGIKLGMLPQGRWRELTEKEVKRLSNISISKEHQDD